MVHEIGHAVGLFHEHQRADREKHLFLVDENLDERYRDIYAIIHPGTGPYDYASTMHYPLWAASGNGLTAAETIPPGIRVPSSGLSAGDIDGVARLYGMRPTGTTVTTNPPGLKVQVDGVPMTTPATLDWAQGSVHSLEVPSPQVADGSRYLFGTWNDGGGRVRSVTADPDTTWLEVTFIVHHQVATSVEPSGSGTVTVSPSSPDRYYTVRTPLTVSAAENTASVRQFMKWTGKLFGTHGAASNPARSKADWPGMEFKAVFTDQPFFSIDSTGDPVVVHIDDEEHYAPTALSVDESGSTVQIRVKELQLVRGRGALRYRFEGWSDRGELSRKLTLPSEGGSVTARVQPELPLYRYMPRRDSGSIDADPPGDDGYHREGAVVSLTASPNPNWGFVGWVGEVSARSPRVALEIYRARRVDAVFSQARKLRVGVPQAVELRSTVYSIYAHDKGSGFRVEPPPNARELTIRFDASTPDVEVDLLVDADSESLAWSYAEDGTTPVYEADFQSVLPGSSESVVITRRSERGLGSALAYYISLVVRSPRTWIDGTLRASVRLDPESLPVPVASPRASALVAPVDSDPASQIVRPSNDGLGSLQYAIESGSAWLMENPSTGTLAAGGSEEIAISVASAGVAPDTHWGNLVIGRSDLPHDDPSGIIEFPVAFAALPAN